MGEGLGKGHEGWERETGVFYKEGVVTKRKNGVGTLWITLFKYRASARVSKQKVPENKAQKGKQGQ